jgi:hypothetical protein
MYHPHNLHLVLRYNVLIFTFKEATEVDFCRSFAKHDLYIWITFFVSGPQIRIMTILLNFFWRVGFHETINRQEWNMKIFLEPQRVFFYVLIVLGLIMFSTSAKKEKVRRGGRAATRRCSPSRKSSPKLVKKTFKNKANTLKIRRQCIAFIKHHIVTRYKWIWTGRFYTLYQMADLYDWSPPAPLFL